MRKPIVHDIMMVIIVHAAKILTRRFLHLIGEREAVERILRNYDAQSIQPLIYEQKGSPDSYPVMSLSNARFIVFQGSSAREMALSCSY